MRVLKVILVVLGVAALLFLGTCALLLLAYGSGI